MAVYFSGQGAGQTLTFANSMLTAHIQLLVLFLAIMCVLTTLSVGFTKAVASANYFFWLRDLEPDIQETKENEHNGPKKGCSSYDFQEVGFFYPLAPDHRVLKGISVKVRDRASNTAWVGTSSVLTYANAIPHRLTRVSS